MNDALTWPQAMVRMKTPGYRTATGLYRMVEPGEDEVLLRFWHELPERWRVEDSEGLCALDDGERRLSRADGVLQVEPRGWVRYADAHPGFLLHAPEDRHLRLDDPNDFSVPMGPGEEIEIAGRRAWRFRLAPPPRKSHPLTVCVDDATGVILRLGVPEAGYVAELVEFTPDVPLPAGVFAWDGPVNDDLIRERDEELADQTWVDEQEDLPTPRYWPLGVAYMSNRGSAATGAYFVTLEVNGYPDLARWPIGGEPPPHWDRNEHRHHHTWTDGPWQWTLAVDEPLSDEDLAKVIASMLP